MISVKAYLGLDVGSVSTNLVLVADDGKILNKYYLRTEGKPIEAVKQSFDRLRCETADDLVIAGAGATGSARNLIGRMVGADLIKNEITAHAAAASFQSSGVGTVMEIGGQDSKLIILRNGIVTDFAMNSVCAAGTGSFLDQQAARLNIPIEKFGDIALKSVNPVKIAGRCAVFAESDMIHKQQIGHSIADILAGLCDALVYNYINNLGKGKKFLEPIIFQGGVAANIGMKAAFEKALQKSVIVPEHYNVMGALGVALLARQSMKKGKTGCSKFKGLNAVDDDYNTDSFECNDCSNCCEVVCLLNNGIKQDYWNDRCGKWSGSGRSDIK